jgi:Cys-tRNA(Pro)/Cys-tRNA(Cys) deacylase
MTPAITAAAQAGVAFEVLEYPHSADVQAYGLEAAEALGLPPEHGHPVPCA